mmetsp:Transcript_13942/g.21266  ORF Transcript_13942/g.21266 Transcript_13942/m.21266 type:complete len:113 (+) Transcript_13942:134-472(+)|eukprot:CAMPEP_0178914494 /NCGR_PEP_ID=MMETSP0786-20121207/11459_1 /TAXON_ID=186022 /ORGANISM="Thalassionema frauenfeldii, Strain CCMP 1798" /LENGTH=112 /DNA_ID=CAMNT_0020587413 /DNA_START=80 /DNA_END=418 /DNA_ORIENTATION=+
MSRNMMLAQLMQDLQDPEMMKEAQKMMNSPEFQAQMKKMAENPQFKQAMKQTQDLMSDPEKAKAYEAKMKEALEQGSKQLEEYNKKVAETEGNDGKPAAEDDVPDVPNLNIN